MGQPMKVWNARSVTGVVILLGTLMATPLSSARSSASADSGNAAGPGVFRYRDANGVTVFSDRPGAAAARDKVTLAPVNLLEATRPILPAAGPQDEAREPLDSSPKGAQDGAAQNSQRQICMAYRQDIQLLLRQRRQGYQAEQARSMKSELRRLQSAMKLACGTWQ